MVEPKLPVYHRFNPNYDNSAETSIENQRRTLKKKVFDFFSSDESDSQPWYGYSNSKSSENGESYGSSESEEDLNWFYEEF